MEQDIKILEESIIQGKYHLYKKDLKKFVSNVIKAYKELEEENTVLKKANNISENVTVKDITKFMNKSLKDFKKEYINVSLVEETIEELKDEICGDDEYLGNRQCIELELLEKVQKKLLERRK